ncbi:Transmembrane protein [Gossypium australe]|uniref:Transmembrane protein n=1 Tax=Gossypium australe TaxID=47621 RepID=A0A5B6UM72_9ROSI|nr:Transmembrane protein [Gossypium australe]
MDHAFTNTIAPPGTSYPPMVQSLDGTCGSRRGSAGKLDIAHSIVTDVVSVPASIRTCMITILLQVKKVIYHAAIIIIFLLHPSMLVDQLLQHSVQLFPNLFHLLFIPSEPIQNRQELRTIRCAAIPKRLRYNLPELPRFIFILHFIPVIPLPRNHPHYVVKCQVIKHGFQLYLCKPLT